MSTSLKTICYIAALFLAGAVTGGIVGACTAKRMMFLHPQRPHELAEHLRNQLEHRLDLTSEQKRKIDPILDQTDTQLRAIHQETMTRVAQLIDQTQAKIAAELTPVQKTKLEQLENERRRFMERHPHGPFQGRRLMRDQDEPPPHDEGQYPPPPPKHGPDNPPGNEPPPEPEH